jgi:hypothetical protein
MSSSVLQNDSTTSTKWEYQPMDPVVKSRWLDALRSGDFEQGREFLERVDETKKFFGLVTKKSSKYCCLGVLASIESVPKSVNDSSDVITMRYDFGDFSEDLEDGFGSSESMIPEGYLGISYNAAITLADMNDSGANFIEIANWIEENL